MTAMFLVGNCEMVSNDNSDILPEVECQSMSASYPRSCLSSWNLSVATALLQIVIVGGCWLLDSVSPGRGGFLASSAIDPVDTNIEGAKVGLFDMPFGEMLPIRIATAHKHNLHD